MANPRAEHREGTQPERTSLEVIRIYRGLVEEDAARPESSFAFYLDEASLVTLGICYERAPRFGGGAYHVSVANYYFARRFLRVWLSC